MSSPRRAGRAVVVVTFAALAVAGCTNPRDTFVAPPSATTAPDGPEVTEPGITEPDVTEPGVTEPEATEPGATQPTTEPSVSGTEPPSSEPTTSEPPTSEPTTSEPSTSEPPTSEPDDQASDVAPEPDDDRNETSLVAAIIGLLGFVVLLVLAARWMVGLDDRREGEPPLPRDPDDGLPTDQMSL